MALPSMKQNASGFFEIHWTEDGRGKRISTKSKDLAAATAFFSSWLMRGTPRTQTASLTVAEAWAHYEAQHLRDPKRVADPASIEACWRNLASWFGSVRPQDIDQAFVDGYERARAAGRIGRRAASVTVRKELGALRACLNWCADPRRGLLASADLPLFDLPADAPPRDRWLTTDELRKLFDAASKRRAVDGRLTRVERFLWLALETAARKQAILDLTWDRVDFERGVVRFTEPGRRQTKKRRADVPISAALRPVLERAFRERANNRVLGDGGEIWDALQVIVREAGIETRAHGRSKATGISPHTLRHTAATHMARNGVPIWQIAKILGNTSATVEKVYAKWFPDSPETTVDLISKGLISASA